jgi:hypothetical protein
MDAEKRTGKTVIATPTWVLVVRIFQIIISLIVIGMSGWWVHGLYADQVGFAIVSCIFTWIVVAYALVSEKVPSARHLYNTWAVLALDALMIIFWLAAMGALAAYRSTFRTTVQASCYSDGSAINSGRCDILKRAVGVASFAALDILSGTAGLCAVLMLLFVASFAYVAHIFRLSLVNKTSDAEKPAVAAGTNGTDAAAAGAVPAAQQSQPLLNQQQQAYPQQPYQTQELPQQAGYVQPQQTVYPQQVPSPEPQYQQNPPYDAYAQQNTASYASTGYQSPQQQPQELQQETRPYGQ